MNVCPYEHAFKEEIVNRIIMILPKTDFECQMEIS